MSRASCVTFIVIACWCTLDTYGWSQDRKHDHPSSKCAADIDPNKPGGPQLTPMAGKVEVEGQKVTFFSDKDQRAWKVLNPKTLKEYNGKHVTVDAVTNEEKGTICTYSVKTGK